MIKRAVVTGSKGQDGYYLTMYLQEIGYEVFGIDLSVEIDLAKFEDVEALIKDFKPREIYHLAAYHQSSEDIPKNDLEVFKQSYQTNVLSTAHLLEALRQHCPKTRLFYANSCLVYGNPPVTPQDENTPFNPHCVYGFSKYQSLKLCELYRQKHGVFAANGILFNHESPRRSPRYVSRKIVQGALDIRYGKSDKLLLGDLNAEVDWGYAGDVVRAMQAILQLDEPRDLVIATGITHKIRDFVNIAFKILNLDPQKHIEVDKKLLIRKKGVTLKGDPSMLKKLTGWSPEVSFADLVKMMVEAELNNRYR
jgi:GDPmannose 4,6-dehydratase